MLVLTRKQDQQIQIGDNITLTILRVKGNTVRVGIDAPREVRVVRGELPKEAQTTQVTERKIKDFTIVFSDEEQFEVSSRQGAERPPMENAPVAPGRTSQAENRLRHLVSEVTGYDLPMPASYSSMSNMNR